MKRVLVLFGVLICMLSFVACDKATGSEAPATSGIITRTEEKSRHSKRMLKV